MKRELRTYGSNLYLVKEDTTKCIESIWNNFNNHQCTRKRVVGDYCKQHSVYGNK